MLMPSFCKPPGFAPNGEITGPSAGQAKRPDERLGGTGSAAGAAAAAWTVEGGGAAAGGAAGAGVTAGAGAGNGLAATGAESGAASTAPRGRAGGDGGAWTAGAGETRAGRWTAAEATFVGPARPPVRYSTGAGGEWRAQAQSAPAAVRIAMSPGLRITSES
jgi:hypothetical protein